MATPMRSTQFRQVVEPILNEGFDGVYDQRSDEWKQIFIDKAGIPKAYHEEFVQYGFGAAPEVPDGAGISYQEGGVLFTQRYQYKVYGLAFALTKVLVEDGDAQHVGTAYSKHLAQSLVETKETLCANILNRAFTVGANGGDGVPLNANNHPIINGVYSNILPVAAAFSQTSLEQMIIQIRNAVDGNGKRIRIEPQKLTVPTSLMLQAEVVLKSVLRTGTANNDINPIVSRGLLQEPVAVISRLTSTTAWWVQTSAQSESVSMGGLKVLRRRKLDRNMEGDFETDSMRYKATERYAVGWTEPRAMYGTPGI